jgi:hypothetical protein
MKNVVSYGPYTVSRGPYRVNSFSEMLRLAANEPGWITWGYNDREKAVDRFTNEIDYVSNALDSEIVQLWDNEMEHGFCLVLKE